jgi:hypothetical protein
MCGRYVRHYDKQRIAEHFQVHGLSLPDFGPSWNVAPQTFQPVIRLNRDTGEREIVLMRWGLVPFWILLANSEGAPEVSENGTLLAPPRSIYLFLSAPGIRNLTSIDFGSGPLRATVAATRLAKLCSHERAAPPLCLPRYLPRAAPGCRSRDRGLRACREGKLLPGCMQDHRLVVEIEEREVWTRLVICIRLCLPDASMFEAGRQIILFWMTFPTPSG